MSLTPLALAHPQVQRREHIVLGQEGAELEGRHFHLLQFRQVPLDVVDHLRSARQLTSNKAAPSVSLTRLLSSSMQTINWPSAPPDVNVNGYRRMTAGMYEACHLPSASTKTLLPGLRPKQHDRPELVLGLVFQEHDRIDRRRAGELLQRDVGHVEFRREVETGDFLDAFLGVEVFVDGGDFFEHVLLRFNHCNLAGYPP